jgi:hypothetical protein
VNLLRATSLAMCLLGVSGVLAAGPLTTADGKLSAGAQANVKTSEVTGQHRGYTNEKLFLKLDDDKEMTFVVKIPGDKDDKWHKDFETLSRITVTYYQGPGDKLPVATAIRKATK